MADNVLEILVKATDLASGTLKKVDAEVEKLGKTAPATGSKWSQAMAAMKSAASSSMGQMLTLAGGVTAVGGAVVATAKFVNGAVNDWVAYNEEVRKLSLATGAGADGLSRMLQAADDVGVSMDAMQTSLKLAAKNGIQPTVANIAALSDRLRAMSSDTERSQEMAKIFGRGWAEVAPFILQGGDAIRAATSAVSDNLVVTDQSIRATSDYREAMDQLNDSITGVKNNIAQDALPAMTAFLDEINRTDVVNRMWESFTKMNMTLYELNPLAQLSSKIFGVDIYNAIKHASDAVYEGTSRWDAYAEATQTTNGVVEDTVKVIDYAELSTRNYSDALLLAMASTELTAEQTYLLQKNLGMVDSKSTYAAIAMERLNKKLENGFMTVEEYAAAVGALKNNIAGLHDKDVNITVRISEYRQDLSGTGGAKKGPGPTKYPTVGDGVEEIPQKAAGGPVRGGGMYWVGERGPELFVPNQSGTIIPNNQVTNNYNMTVNTNAPSSTVFNDFNLMRALGA